MTPLFLALWVASAGAGKGRAIAHDPALEEGLPWACDAPLGDAERVVLLLAQDGYPASAGLSGQPLGDARVVGGALEAEGFVVRACTNLGLEDMGAVLSAFKKDLARQPRREAVGVYYAGHAFQIGGIANQKFDFLIPVDFAASDEASARTAAYPVSALVTDVEPPAKSTWQSFVILDACRNDPWSRAWDRGTSGRGLGTIDEPEVPFRVLVAHTTKPGDTAANDGLFARTFASHIAEGQDLTVLLRDVKRSMQSAGQVPTWEEDLERGLVLAQVAAQFGPPSPGLPPRSNVTSRTYGGPVDIGGERVEVAPFEGSVRPVDQALYERLMGHNPSWPTLDGRSAIGPDLPVQFVTLAEAAEFCNKLSEDDGHPPYYDVSGGGVSVRGGLGWRMPTAAEYRFLDGTPYGVDWSNAGEVMVWLEGDGRYRDVGGGSWWPVAPEVASPWRGIWVVRSAP